MRSEVAQILKDFSEAFREATGKVYHAHSLSQKVPLNDVVDALVEASYCNLLHAIRTKLLLLGTIRQASTSLKDPRERIAEDEKASKEILSIVARVMRSIDTKHEYSIGMVKRERRPQ